MLIAIYTKGNQVNKAIIKDMDSFITWCEQYKPREVWVLNTDTSKIENHFMIETKVIIKEL